MTDNFKLVHVKNLHGYTSKILKDDKPVEITVVGTYRSKYDINRFNQKAIDALKLTINNYRHRLYNNTLCDKINNSFCNGMDVCDDIVKYVDQVMKTGDDQILKSKKSISVPFRTDIKNIDKDIEPKDILRFVSAGINTDRTSSILEDNKVRTPIVIQHDNNIKEVLDVNRGQLNDILINKTYTCIMRMKFGLFIPKAGSNIYITLKCQTMFLKYIHTDQISTSDEDKQRILKQGAVLFDDITKNMIIDEEDLEK